MLDLAQLILFWPSMLFLFAYIMHGTAVRGSHMRYVTRSVLRPTQWMAVAYFAVRIIVNQQDGDIFFTMLSIFNTAWIADSIRQFYKSDEDDWFTGRGKKIMRWLRRKLTFNIRVPNLAPQGA